ncbi:MAG TPA: zf-HC2 domain-containing protein [Acidobacteriaceae bacterium]
MSEIFQPGQHPDADQLSAFVEHSLPGHEQQKTLAHLAVCADCRAIVYLAEGASMVESAQPRPVAARRPWFSGWNLAWPAVAGLACLVVLTVYLRKGSNGNHQTGTVATARIEQMPSPVPATAPPAQEVPLKPSNGQVQIPQPVAVSKAGAVGKESTTKSLRVDGIAKQESLNSPLENRSVGALTASRPEFGFTPATSVGRQTARGAMSFAGPQAAAPASATPSPMAVLSNANSSQPATENMSGLGLQQFHGNLAGAAQQGSQSGPATQRTFNQQVEVTAAPTPVLPTNVTETVSVNSDTPTLKTESTPSSAVIGGTLGSFAMNKAAPKKQPALPSHLPPLSTASNARQELAIDTAGKLFRSEDAGVTWKQVPAQWTGRAIKVMVTPSRNLQSATKDASAVTEASTAAKRVEAAPAAPLSFELTTDNGEIWISTDGQAWKRK